MGHGNKPSFERQIQVLEEVMIKKKEYINKLEEERDNLKKELKETRTMYYEMKGMVHKFMEL